MINDYNTRSKTLIISLVVLFVSLIILIWSLATAANRNSVKVINISAAEDEGLQSQVISNAAKKVYSLLKRLGYNVSGADISIRDVSNYNKESGKGFFLVDVDSIKQTFRFYYDGDDYSIGCPHIEETNYPDSYCVANSRENDDTATMVLGKILPYDGSTESGTKYRIYRKELDTDLYVYIFACEGNSEADSSVQTAVSNLIKDRGANPSIFPVVYEHNNCSE